MAWMRYYSITALLCLASFYFVRSQFLPSPEPTSPNRNLHSSQGDRKDSVSNQQITVTLASAEEARENETSPVTEKQNGDEISEADAMRLQLEPEYQEKSEDISAETEINYADHLYQVGIELLNIDGDIPKATRSFRVASALGNADAMANLALLQLGEGPKRIRDIGKGTDLLRMAAALGNPAAYGTLAFLHASGIADRYGVEENMGKAMLYWNFAAESEHLPSAMALGFRYLYGVDVQKNCKLAAKYYASAARLTMEEEKFRMDEEGFLSGKPPMPKGFEAVSPSRLEWENNGDGTYGDGGVEEEMSSYFAQEAVRGDIKAQYTLGVLHMLGDRPKAEKLFLDAAKKDHPEALALLGFFALNDYRLEKALHYFRLSAEHNCNIGMYGLGMMHYFGLGGAGHDKKVAARYLTRAAVTDCAEAAYFLALMYKKGDGVVQSPEDCNRFLQRAAVIGFAPAKYELALMRLETVDYTYDHSCREAVSLLKQVSEEGEWRKVLFTGSEAYEAGDNYVALYRYTQAAHAGSETAQNNAAFLHERRVHDLERSGLLAKRHPLFSFGKELEHWDGSRHLRNALRLYELSGFQGQSRNLVHAGDMMYNRDAQYSKVVYKQASESENAEALFNLGWMSSQGILGKRDGEMAKRYWERARRADNDAYLATLIALSLGRIYAQNKFGISRFTSFLRDSIRGSPSLLKSEIPFLKFKTGNKLDDMLGRDVLVITTLLLCFRLVRWFAARAQNNHQDRRAQ